MTHATTPILGAPSFRCPHCGAIAHQDWMRLGAKTYDKGRAPFIPDATFVAKVHGAPELSEEQRREFILWAQKMWEAKIFLQKREVNSFFLDVENLYISRCYSCEAIAVWVHDRLLFPAYMLEIQPNEDLPEEIKTDFTEAAKILDMSPRGSAALLRLCIQKLCKHLGKTGKDLNQDIASLIKDGLDKRIQRSLDVVRVVGNNAVHPGQVVTDNRDTAYALFRLVNMIADAMITQPKHVDELYGSLPDTAKQQIEKRDAPKAGQLD